MRKEKGRQEKGVRKKMSSNADAGNAGARIRNESNAAVKEATEKMVKGEYGKK